jgi:hypothetical protein
MAYDSDLETLLDEATHAWSGVQKKKMFGGLVYTTGGNICVGIWRDQLILRVGTAAGEMLAADPRFAPFDVTGRALRGWTMLGSSGWRDPEVRRQAVARARAFCRTLPDKA